MGGRALEGVLAETGEQEDVLREPLREDEELGRVPGLGLGPHRAEGEEEHDQAVGDLVQDHARVAPALDREVEDQEDPRDEGHRELARRGQREQQDGRDVPLRSGRRPSPGIQVGQHRREGEGRRHEVLPAGDPGDGFDVRGVQDEQRSCDESREGSPGQGHAQEVDEPGDRPRPEVAREVEGPGVPPGELVVDEIRE